MIEAKAQITKLNFISHFGKQVDFSNTFMSLNIFDDIFSNFLTAKLVLPDSLDLEVNLPIIGGEKVEIQILGETKDMPVAIDFYVYKLDRDVKVSNEERKHVKVLYLCTLEGLTNGLKALSRKFSGTGHEIIQSVLDIIETEKEFFNEPTKNEIDVYSGFWSPFKLINYVTKHSESEDGNNSYMFFENLEGFNFKTVQGMLGEDPLSTVDIDSFDMEKQFSVNNIRGYMFDSFFSVLEQQIKHGAGNTHYMTNYEYGFSKSESVPKGFLIENLYDANNTVKQAFNEPKLKGKRNSYMSEMDNYNLTIKMHGDLNKTAGKTLTVDFPAMDNERLFNPKYTGNWLITSVNHQFLLDESYTQNIAIWKDEFFGWPEEF